MGLFIDIRGWDAACRACTDFFGQAEAWRCFHAQYAARRIQLPLLFHQYVYDSANLGYDQASTANFSNFRRQFLQSLLHDSLYIFPAVPPPPPPTSGPAPGPIDGGAHGTWRHPVSASPTSAPSEAPSPGRDPSGPLASPSPLEPAQGPSGVLALKGHSGPDGLDVSVSAHWGDRKAEAPAVGGEEAKSRKDQPAGTDQESNSASAPSGPASRPAPVPSPSASNKNFGDDGGYDPRAGSEPTLGTAASAPREAPAPPAVRNPLGDLANPLVSTMAAAWQYISPFTQALNASALQSILQLYLPPAYPFSTLQQYLNNARNVSLVPGSISAAQVGPGSVIAPVTNSYRSLLQVRSLEGPELNFGQRGAGKSHVAEGEVSASSVASRKPERLEGGANTYRDPVGTAEVSVGSPSVPRNSEWQADHPGTQHSRVMEGGSTVPRVPDAAGPALRRALQDVSQRDSLQAVHLVKKPSSSAVRAGGPAQETESPPGQFQGVDAPFTVFAPACHLHEIIDSDLFAFSHIGSTRLQEVLQEWFFEGGAHHWVMDEHQGILPVGLCEPLVPPLTEQSPRWAQTMADKTTDRLWLETMLGTNAA